MEQIKEFVREPYDATQLVRGLNLILSSSGSAADAFDILVQEAYWALQSDHLFLSRYYPEGQTFQTVAWRSPIHPSEVTLEQKFMGSSYSSGQPVIVQDLTQFNYRLRPAVARMGLMSMIGVPIMGEQRVLGVLEAFSKQKGYFSEADIAMLNLFARLAAGVIERSDLIRDRLYQSAETDFLLEALKLEQASVGSLFFKVGETFASVLGLDGIAVFGLEPNQEENPLQEVMAQGFTPADINRLKTLYNREFLRRLAEVPDQGQELPIIKQSFKRAGGGGTKLLYVVPVMHRRVLYGVVVFYWVEMEQTPDMPETEKFIRRLIGHITMVLSRKELYTSIQKVSFYDLLTGLANRRLFDYVLEREIKKIKRSGKALSLLMIDIDYFKTVNDLYGHLVGDSILEQVGQIIKDTFRGEDLPARYGGEEFAIILPDTDRDEALALAEQLREGIAKQQFPVGNRFVNVTISIGGATCTKQMADNGAEGLILAADKALYQAKQLGRNLTIFTTGAI